MKLGLLQCNTRNGDLWGNAQRLVSMAREATSLGAELIVCSEDALGGPQGYSYGQLPQFVQCSDNVRDYLANELDGRAPFICALPFGSPMLVHNGIAMQAGGQVFVAGKRITLVSRRCAMNPEAADLMLDLRSRSFRPGWDESMEQELAVLAKEKDAPCVNVNLVGGYGSWVYPGSCTQVGTDGAVQARALAFEEQVLVYDLENGAGIESCPRGLEAQWRALVLGIRDFVRKAGARQCVVGLSGGIDSALVACLACEALGSENLLGVLLPSPYTSDASLRDASQLAANLDMPTFTLPIENLMKSFERTLDPLFANLPRSKNDLTWENLQARIRAVLLMAVANRLGALVLNTGNLSESSMGYSTLYGDSIGALGVLGDLLKTRVYELARWRCEREPIIPLNILEREPSAELRPNQKDSDSLPPYAELDRELACLMQGQVVKPETLERTLANEFKRFQAPPPLMVGEYQLVETPVDGYFRFTRDN